MRRVVLVVLLALLSLLGPASRPAEAQVSGTGRIEGSIVDSVRSGPVAGASVSALRLDAAAESALVVRSDARGRFRFDGVTPGRYAVTFASPFLDSLEYGGPASQVVVTPGRSARLDLAVPSSRTLRAAACPGVNFAANTGALVGLVNDADTDRPLPGARVVVAWEEHGVDSTLKNIVSQARGSQARTDASGQFRLCGVRTDTWLLVQIQRDGQVGDPFTMFIADSTSVLVRNFSLSAEGLRSVASAEQGAVDTMARRPLIGTASLSGVVRGANGQPIVGAQVRVVRGAPTARTDPSGAYLLAGLPAGTQELEVRHVGYRFERVLVELRRGQTTRQDMVVERIATLDSIRSVARRVKYREFDMRRRLSHVGKFLDEDEIARRNVEWVSDLVTMAGFMVIGRGVNATVINPRLGTTCEAAIQINNSRFRTINEIPIGLVAAMEFYPARPGPGPFDEHFAGVAYDDLRPRTACGLIRIWTKRS